ncbi:splicing regulatory glutamine/lysine-rich protein 1 [Drosophila teissieri]|uniref:splicing regulatory glutamine/lysine-rich protein 1 n=1 Tax=Drosophila teissieri TaxID=7243 RepID=UPI001CBA2C6F|nr:splicing regulatory glutamine/lysine-rich protein 1 [Drosophila teissieri]
MSKQNSTGFRSILKNIYKREMRGNRKQSYDMEDTESQKLEKKPSAERKEDRKERRKEQEMERKREVERRKELAREKEQEKQLEKQNQQKWHKELEKERQREKELQRDQRRQEPTSTSTSTSSRRVNAEVTKFDEEFERDLEKLERSICQLDFRSKTMATMWMDKLRQPPQSAAETRSRNVIAAHLLKCSGDSIFKKEPFNHPPPPQNLTTIREKMFLTRDSTCHGMPISKQKEPSANLTQLFSDSYDGGEFLSQLPVPRDGAFFIYHMQPNF